MTFEIGEMVVIIDTCGYITYGNHGYLGAVGTVVSNTVYGDDGRFSVFFDTQSVQNVSLKLLNNQLAFPASALLRLCELSDVEKVLYDI